MRTRSAAALLALSSGALVLARESAQAPVNVNKRELTGRFMHITDFHPDPHYKTGATFDSGCHQVPKKKKKKGGKGKGKGKGKLAAGAGDAGDGIGLGDDNDGHEDEEEDEDEVQVESEDLARPWGSAVSDCDSPMALVNYTLSWLQREWADEVDFVVWTGDNARQLITRHDIDRDLPRTPHEIMELNTMLATRMRETFGPDVPVVPSLGNNDIYPHNVMGSGPSSLTEGMLRAWKHFIPDDYDHVFERGAYYASEVIPDRLAVISLNTLYWYDSNTLVDGCIDGSSDPGALEFDWLEVQLDTFRERGMQVWLTGHVPPHSGNYYDTCWLRYGDLALRYQDTIVGHLFGHMNIDHFFFLDVPELESRETKMYATGSSAPGNSSLQQQLKLKSVPQGPSLRHGEPLAAGGRYRVAGRNGNAALVDSLRRDFGDMPGPNKLKHKDYAVMNVAPSIIPTYIPAVRIYSYNVTAIPALDLPRTHTLGRKHGHKHPKKKPNYKCKSPVDADKPHCRFKTRPRYANSTSPSRTNGPLSPLGYTQFYLPDIDSTGPETPPEWKIEYSTFRVGDLLPVDNGTEVGRGGQKVPVPSRFLPGYDGEVLGRLLEMRRGEGEDMEGEAGNGNGKEEEGASLEERVRAFRKSLKRITPWKMKDLTIPQYVKLARKLVAEKKMWKQFSNLMFVSAL